MDHYKEFKAASGAFLGGLILLILSLVYLGGGRAPDPIKEVGFPAGLAVIIMLLAAILLVQHGLPLWRERSGVRPGVLPDGASTPDRGPTIDPSSPERTSVLESTATNDAAHQGAAKAEPRSFIERWSAPINWILLIAYVVLMPRIGYLVATPVYIAAALKINGATKPLTAALIAVSVTAGLYAAFTYGLGVRFP